MFSKDQDYLSLTLDSDSFKVAHIRISPAEKKLLDVSKRNVREVPPENIASTLRDALREFKLKKARAICVIPPQSITTKNIEVPSIDPVEIKSIIDLQAGRHTPYSREEILVGYISIGVFQRNYTKILLAIVNRDVVKNMLITFGDAGIKIERILFVPEGIARFYAQALKIKQEDVPKGIINVANQSTDFIVEFNQTVATSRSIPIGMSHLIKEGQPAQEKLVGEIIKSIEAYQNEDIHALPDGYILTCDDPKIKELQPVLEEKLKVSVKIVSYLDYVQAPQPVMLKLVSEYQDDSFLDLIAIGLHSAEVEVDLTPEEVKLQKSIEEKGREMVKSAILAILLLFFVSGMFFSKIYFRSIFLNQLEEEYDTKHKAVSALDAVTQRTSIIKDYLNSRMVTLETFNELYQMLPDEIYLESITMDEKGKITIQGVSESMSRVFNLVTSLQNSSLFKTVKTTSTTAKKDRGKDVAAFEIVFKLASAKDEKEEAGGQKDKGKEGEKGKDGEQGKSKDEAKDKAKEEEKK